MKKPPARTYPRKGLFRGDANIVGEKLSGVNMTIIQANKFYFPRGGAERYVLDLSAWLEGQGHRVAPFAMAHPDNLPTPYARFFPSRVLTEEVRMNAQGLHTVGRMLYSLEARRKMASLVAETKPALCHIHNIYTQLSPSVLDTLRVMRVPVAMTVHDHHLVSPQYNVWAPGCGKNADPNAGVLRLAFSRFHKDSFAASLLQAAAFRFHRRLDIWRRGVDLFICPSRYMAGRLVAAGFPKERIRVNPYGIDPSAFRPTYAHEGYVLFVGRLVPEKGVETLIEAAKLLPDVPFRIVGTGPDEARLRGLAHGTRNMRFLGHLGGEALEAAYRGALAVAVPSRVEETFPLVTLEAMAHGKPVVASAVGGIPEQIDDRHTGWLLPPLDAAAWAEAFRRLAEDERFRLGLARAARAEITGRFHLRHHHERLLETYVELTACG